ncbi:MAG TPA: hypothetical protein VH143_00585 [Kofleriaceae bacterium]|jgi:hypothetical protein|nr:hypothetical protein [Kofleriaceae bacterium]
MKALAILCVLAGTAAAQPSPKGSAITIPLDDEVPQVSAAAAPSAVKLGSRFTLFVTATFAPGVIVNLREPLDLGGAFEVKKRVSVDSVDRDGQHRREWQIEVYAWDLGDLEVPPVAVTFTSNGHAGQVASNAVPIRVSGVLGDADDPKLLRGLAAPVVLFQRTWLWNLLHDPLELGIAIAVLVAIFMFARWPRKRRVAAMPEPELVFGPKRELDMTSERALEKLREIERSGVLGRDGDRKRGYAEMADVIREYVGARFAILAARELTSGELVAALPASAREVVAVWLDRCDPVKYGGELGTTNGAAQTLDAAKQLVTR